jgi:hypothetical protein
MTEIEECLSSALARLCVGKSDGWKSETKLSVFVLIN